MMAPIMKMRIVVGLMAAVVAAAGCSKKKPEEGKEPAVGPVAGSGTAGSGSAASEAPKPDAKLVARGEYLTNVLGCPFCHMPMGPQGPDTTRPFAGGLEVPDTFGTWRAPNITPDKGSGIGSWTTEQIVAAIREGVRPDGSHLFPIMPYPNYNRLTDDDATAVATYLQTVPAVENVVAPNKDLKLPQIPAPKPANQPDEVGDPVKHGEYLVTVMHCDMCHTPAKPDMSPDLARSYAGGFEMELPMMGTGKLYASNITSDKDTGIGKWSEADIAKAIKTMTRPDGTMIQGPMQLYLAGWSKLEDKDLDAVAAYVKQIPAVKNKVQKSTFKPNPMGPPPGAGSATGSAN
jgi:mono/diheme cytochrome c family protein